MAGIGLPVDAPMVHTGADGHDRCAWATQTGRDLSDYHDHAWGVPSRDSVVLFRELTLTFFEAGLSWSIVYDKRPAFEEAFHGFDAEAVARFTGVHVDRLLGDAGIIRSRAKIEAAISNARVIVDDPAFVDRVWRHAPRTRHALRSPVDGRMRTPESTALAAEMKRVGYRFVGPVVVHSFMQTIGVEDGHFDGCFGSRVSRPDHRRAASACSTRASDASCLPGHSIGPSGESVCER